LIDIGVPLQTQGRTTKHRERYMMARFLATLAAGGELLSFPLHLDHREKPDFGLHMPNASIGVECVEATSTEWAQIQAIRERDFPEALIFLPVLTPGETKFTIAERVEIARGDRAGPGWAGKMTVRQWAAAQAYFVNGKTKKLRAGHYAEFGENWLLIQDEWPVPMHYLEDFEEAAALCASLIAPQLDSPAFTHIFVVDSSRLIQLAPTPTDIRAIHDLWK
jgi:hypothetical protein